MRNQKILLLILLNILKMSTKNIINNISLKNLEKTKKEKEFFLTAFYEKNAKTGNMLKKIINNIAKFSVHNKSLFFGTINFGKISKKSKRSKNLKNFKNEIILFIKGNIKKYDGEKNLENLMIWLKDIFEIKPFYLENFSKVDPTDSHYFVFCSKYYFLENKEKINILAKMIYPLVIYYGEDLGKEVFLQNLEKNKKKNNLEKKENLDLLKNNIFIYREYKKKIKKIPNFTKKEKISNIEKIKKIYSYIIKNEFSDYLNLNKESFKLIFEYKIPGLLYFTKNAKKDKNLKILKKESKKYKDFFLLIIIDENKKNYLKKKKFLKNFLEIKNFPSLRILDLQEKIKRYKFIGNLEKGHLNFFFKNYLKGFLKSYSISEKIKNNKFQGLQKINYKKIKKLFKDIINTNLIYVYSNLTKRKIFLKHISILKKIQKIIKINKYIKISIINHDKNDLDNFYNDDIPFLFLIKRTGKIEHFDKEFLEENILEFFKENIPRFKIDDVFTDEF